jgi:predicted TIM-barrel fold metal-dependent hydrolase
MAQKYDVIDADGHILEPPDLWERHIEPRYRNTCPKLIVDGDGTEYFRLEGDYAIDLGENEKKVKRKFGGLGTIGARDGGLDSLEIGYLAGQKGGFDPHARIADMDRDGIDAAFLYPSLGLFVGTIEDPDFAAASARAYNRWLALEYCAPYPDRLFGVAMLPMQSVPHAVRELRYAVEELGYRAAFVRPNPYGDRVLHSRDYDPLWQAAQDLGCAIGVHSGAKSGQPELGVERFRHSFAVSHFVAHTFEMAAAATSMIMCGVCDRFPGLRVGFMESGGGWMAGWLDRMDRHFDDKGMNDTGLTTRPSEIFRRQCWISFEPVEGALVHLVDYLGADNILWATDYPHQDGFPDAANMIKRLGLKPDALRKVLAEGAKRYYALD